MVAALRFCYPRFLLTLPEQLLAILAITERLDGENLLTDAYHSPADTCHDIFAVVSFYRVIEEM